MSDDERNGSELTEVEEEDYKAPGSRKKTKKVHTDGFRIRHALKAPRASSYSAQALYDQIVGGDIDLDPEYQRAVVWLEPKQISLIDSIFRNFYIPPIIFAVTAASDGSEMKTCIDGKQRLTSIYRFMDGMIHYKDPDTNEKYWYKNTTGKARSILPETYQRLFANKQIVCVEYNDLSDEDEREVFQRVQKGVALTPAEKLQAIKSSRASFVRDLESQYLKEGALGGDNLDWDRSRGSDFRCVAQAIFNLDKFGTQKTMGSLAALEKWLNDGAPLPSKFQARTERAFRVYATIATDRKLALPLKSGKYKRLSPIEFILVAVLVGAHMDVLSLQQLSNAIGGLRDHAREKHKDIRMNNAVSATMLAYIRALDPAQVKGAGEPASKAVDKQKKRKRTKEVASESEGTDDVDMDEDEPSPAPPSRGRPIKREDVPPSPITPSVPTSRSVAPAPSIDRLAVLRAAKANVARSHSGSDLPPPSGSTSQPHSPAIPSPRPHPQQQQSPPYEHPLLSRLTHAAGSQHPRSDPMTDTSVYPRPLDRPYANGGYYDNYGDGRGYGRR